MKSTKLKALSIHAGIHLLLYFVFLTPWLVWGNLVNLLSVLTFTGIILSIVGLKNLAPEDSIINTKQEKEVKEENNQIIRKLGLSSSLMAKTLAPQGYDLKALALMQITTVGRVIAAQVRKFCRILFDWYVIQ